ncbi:hypothetical protein LMJF_03_0650 [Leishmania major strain Friedlin]|uniref:Uncharacterized protein n=1 Tax=Leishmania major TaxID=5664 RepID=E9ACL0_LEIMA|nr:hypothetical protein LMJF_03_0650 [Leishmania major strain Friedlin]CAG9567291.1 hypothetical_protein_-_conserved [Leishmania major strain Friedlin]CBZ12027.1 hypothetical protein LMJF_03_0650 [Leishmania major strain Friedlin]|eukprot:XP_003721741.1 hypothetical protein LMJF_03_0650 [Leishmania major strain Friedlin]
MATMAVMDASLPKTTTAMTNTCQGFAAPLPHPAAVSSPSPCQQPSTPIDTLARQLHQDPSPQPKQYWERRRHSSSSLAVSPSASSASSASHASHTDAYEVAVVAETRRTDVGGSLLQQPTSLPSCTVKSYGTASDISDDGSRSSLSAVVAVHTVANTFDLMTTQTVGYRTPSTRAEVQPGQLEHHAQHPQQRQGQVMSSYAVEFSAYDPHSFTLLDGNAHMVGGVGQSEPAPLARDTSQEPLAPEGGANVGAGPAEGRRPASPAAGGNVGGNGPAPVFLPRSAQSPTGPPPTFVELVMRRVGSTSLLQFLWVVLLVVMLLVGNAFQVIFLNFWIHQFPTKLNPQIAPASSSSASSGSGTDSSSGRHAEALASSYTTFVISAVLFPAFFVVLLITYALWRRPNLRFTREWAGWRLLFGIGAMDALNSALAIYAAANTPEVLQALFVSLVPIYSAIFTKWLLKDPRDYANPYVVVSFVLIATGVALASLFNQVVTHHHHTEDRSGSGHAGVKELLVAVFSDGSSSSLSPVALDRRLWCFIFFLSVPPTVLMNVWQTMYMIRYTSNDQLMAYLAEHADEAECGESSNDVAAGAPGQSTPLLDSARDSHGDAHHCPSPAAGEAVERVPLQPSVVSVSRSLPHGWVHQQHIPHSEHLLHGEDASVKLVMLTSDTAIQAILAVVLMPMDALPWFGGSHSIREVVQNLDEGIDCVLHCPRNMRYCILYSTGFVLVYIASAYLNRYSVTLCSMVSQLSGPITALVLIAFPTLNMTDDASPWYVSVFAIFLLSCGTVLYVYWDEMTVEEKAVGEMQLKWAMMQEQSPRHAPSLAEGQRYHEVDSGVNGSSLATSQSGVSQPQQQQHRHARSRRYCRRRQSGYAVVVDQDASDASASGQPHRY